MAASSPNEKVDAGNSPENQEVDTKNDNSPKDDEMDVDEDNHKDADEIKQEKPESDKENANEGDGKEEHDDKSESADKEDSQSPKDDDNKEDDDDDKEADEDKAEDEDNDEGDENAEQHESTGADIDPIYDQTSMKPIFERRDKSSKELLEAMDEFSPIIPDAVTNYYLTRAGFKTSDVRIKRLLALATQKFVADIANDAYQFSRIRAQSGNTAGAAARGRAPGSSSGRTVSTMESLSGVSEDYGVNAKRPDFFR